MAIKIIDEDEVVYLTRSEHDEMQHEYQRAFTHYAGAVPSFETFVKQRKAGRSPFNPLSNAAKP